MLSNSKIFIRKKLTNQSTKVTLAHPTIGNGYVRAPAPIQYSLAKKALDQCNVVWKMKNTDVHKAKEITLNCIKK